MKATTKETPSRLRMPAAAAAGDARGEAVTALRRFHLGAPDAPVGKVPAGATPAALCGSPKETPEEECPAALDLLRFAIGESQADARRDFARRARELVAQAEALLETERLKGAEGRDPERLSGALGTAGARFLDPAALSGVLGKPRRAAALDEGRAHRLEEAVKVLKEAVETIEMPEPLLVHDGTLSWATDGAESGGWTTLESSDPCAVAAGVFDTQAGYTARILLAARRASLEAAGEYDPARHDLLLEPVSETEAPGSFDWQAFTREELALVPPIVALESADELAARGMVSLSKLLLSGRPVQVLVIDDPTGAPGTESPAEALGGFRFQPAYLGMAQREAFVQQGSISLPDHLAAGFRRSADGARAALHVIETPSAAGYAAAAIAGRAHPLFQYDPEAGTSWADRMDFSGNPEPEKDWPVREIGVEDEEGAAAEHPVALTFADVCLLVPELAGHFLPVPDGVPAEVLATIPEWLALGPDEALERVPSVLAVVPAPRKGRRSETGDRLVRFAVSRPLALACRDRLGYWRTLQELAGVRSEYVRRAEARVRDEAETRLSEERERLAERHAAELERVRRRAVEDVVNRLTAAVLGVDGAAFESPLAQLAGGDVDEVSASLLGMVAGLDPERDGDGMAAASAQGPAKEAVDQVVAELAALVGPLDAIADEALEPATETGGPEGN